MYLWLSRAELSFGSSRSLIYEEEVRVEKRRREGGKGSVVFNKEINNHGTAHSSTSKPVIITQPWPLPVIALLFTAFGASAWGLRHVLGCITCVCSHQARTESHLLHECAVQTLSVVPRIYFTRPLVKFNLRISKKERNDNRAISGGHTRRISPWFDASITTWRWVSFNNWIRM